MKMFLISDNEDTVLGLRFAGIEGIVLHDKAELEQQVDRLVKDKEIGILIFTEMAAALAKDKIGYIKLNCETPLIVEIPGRNGCVGGEGNMLGHIREFIGLKI